MDTVAKLAMIVVVAGLILAAIAGAVTLTNTASSPANIGATDLLGAQAGGRYGAFRDNEIIYGQLGSKGEMSPVNIAVWAAAMMNPLVPRDGLSSGWTDYHEGTDTFLGTNNPGIWLLTIISAAAATLGSIIALKWLTSLVFGAGD